MQPGDVYSGHLICEDGHTGRQIAEQLQQFLISRCIDLSNVLARVVGGDGTAAVAGWKNGWMTHFEALLGRALGRVVCLCHQAELPYRALFYHLDGKTTGPTTFSGPIGKKIAGDVHSLEVASFPTIQDADLPDVPPEIEQDLSSDVRLLYRCAKAAATGDAATVAHLRHGKLSGARWYGLPLKAVSSVTLCLRPSCRRS